MPTLKLTSKAIPGLKAKPNGKRETYRDTVCRGLHVEAHGSGKRTFCAWGRIHGTGRAVRVTLGPWRVGVYELADARKDAREALHLMATGRDPAVEKRRAREAGSFGDLAESYLAAAQIRPRTKEEWERLLRADRLAGLRARRTADITRRDLITLFDKIAADSLRDGGKGYAANRTLEAVRRVFSWAVQKDLLSASPCVGVVKPSRETARRRAYDDRELGAIVRALREDPSPMAAACLLSLFTGTRLGAALGARWNEVDLDVGTWLIPGDRAGTKNGLDWLVPLSAPAVDLLRTREQGEYVFGEGAARRQKVVYRIREHAGVADFRVHDFRRCVNSWLSSRAGGAERLEVRDAILGHRPRGLESIYNVHTYAEEKRIALERWAAHVERVAAAVPGKVLEFGA